MNESDLMTQTNVYFKKLFRINMREKSWKYLIFALIISMLVALIVGPDMFGNFDTTNSGFFTLASACIWIGIFNSIQSICKEHEIIRAEYRQGLRISSYVFAHLLWQALLCLAQTIIIFVVCCIWMRFSGTPTTAMTIMPFVLIIQLIMSGVLFILSGASEVFSYFTLSRWGMAAFGCEADLFHMPTGVQQVEPLFNNPMNSDFYKPEVIRLFAAWFAIIGITIFNTFVCGLALKIKNRDS